MRKAIISLIFLLSFAGAAAASAPPDIRSDAPERYVVQRGDTLWSIASRYLKDAWRWPELARMNRAQVRDPHRIYPGDVLVLERSGGGAPPQVRIESVRVRPQVRVEPRETDAIQTIPPSAIEPFLARPLVIAADELKSAPEIVATEEDRVALGSGNLAYVRGLTAEVGSRWQLFRRGDPLVDPELAAQQRYPLFAPMSTTILSFHKLGTPTPGGRPRLLLERHGSLHVDDLRPYVERLGFGIELGPKAQVRLTERHYAGPPSLRQR